MTDPANPRDEEMLSAASRRELDERSLVLSAERIPHRLVSSAGGWRIEVDADDRPRVLAMLRSYENERARQRARPVEKAEPEYGFNWSAIVVSVALLGFHVLAPPSWVSRGAASARLIRDGEWWRIVTALALHSSAAHVLGNAAAFALFGTAVCRELGPGTGLWLILLAGAGGNAINASLQGFGHRSIGASTAVFGAIGVLSGLQLGRRRARWPGRARAWVPLLAGLALLGWLGGSPDTDVLAHLFGFCTGLGLGIVAAKFPDTGRSRAKQWLLEMAALVAVLGCWVVALS